MLEFKKTNTQFGDQIQIDMEAGRFEIIFAGNLDLYWRYYDRDYLNNLGCSKSFFITKENYFLFQLFDTLYHDIKDYNIYHEDEFITRKNALKLNASVIVYHSYSYRLLLCDEKIEWHNDDHDYNMAILFMIEPKEDAYMITFERCKEKNDFINAVRIRNSGSRYHPFHIPFMRMYLKLCEYEPDYHQIHMEEYLFQKKLVKKKERI